MPLEEFINTWCSFDFCSLQLVENKITFSSLIDIDYYRKKTSYTYLAGDK